MIYTQSSYSIEKIKASLGVILRSRDLFLQINLLKNYLNVKAQNVLFVKIPLILSQNIFSAFYTD